METGYQRGKIQEESLYYEHKKHDGSYPIIGVNTFLNPKGQAQQEIELARAVSAQHVSGLRCSITKNGAREGAVFIRRGRLMPVHMRAVRGIPSFSRRYRIMRRRGARPVP